MHVVETVQVRPTMVLLYDTYLDRNVSSLAKTKPNFDRFANIDKEAYSGLLCPHAKKRLSRALNLLVAVAKPKRIFNQSTRKDFTFRVNFVTLTLPAAQRTVSDRQLKKNVFDPFIKSMRYKHGLKSYVWRAERQFNGNLHFHLTTDCYLPFTSIRDQWNRYLSRFHFIDEFEKNHGHTDPNSTDVHSVSKINNIAAYMVKYMSKAPDVHLQEVNAKRAAKNMALIEPDNHPFRLIDGQPTWDAPIEGKVWDCSLNLKSKDRCEMASDSHTRGELSSILKSPNTTYCETDRCFIIALKKGRMEEVLPKRLRNDYQDYLNRIRNYRRDAVSATRKKLVKIEVKPPPEYKQTLITFPRYNLNDTTTPK